MVLDRSDRPHQAMTMSANEIGTDEASSVERYSKVS